MKFKTSIDLMKLRGAQIVKNFSITGSDGKTRQMGDCVVIPMQYNDMIRKNPDGTASYAPYVNARCWEARPKFVQSCLARHAGEADYIAPTHTVDVNYSKDFEDYIRAIYRQRLQQEKPELQGEDLEREVAIAIRVTLGTLTPIGEEARQQYGGQAVAAAAPAQAVAQMPDGSFAAPMMAPPAAGAPGEVGVIDDLPF